MPSEIDFVQFATGITTYYGGFTTNSANVESQSAWAADSVVTNGLPTGLTLSAQLNKALRQGTMSMAVLSQFINSVTSQSVLDQGSVSTLLVQLWIAFLSSKSFVDIGTVNNIVLPLSASQYFPAPTLKGTKINVQVANTNTGAVTLNFSGYAAPTKTRAGAALTSGMLVAGGYYSFIWDLSEWQLLN